MASSSARTPRSSSTGRCGGSRTRRGFNHCWCMDHFATLGGRDDGPIFEAWALLAAMAAATSRTRVGCAVTGNSYRHPAVLAKAAVTVDHLSGGRLEDACQVIRSLWTQERASFAGQYYQLTGAVAEPKPVQQPHPPIWVGGAGRQRTLRITARYADVWNAAWGSPDEVAEVSAVLDQRCAEIGRDPAKIRRSVQFRVSEASDELVRLAESYHAVGVTEIVLILDGANPGALAEQVAGLLPRMRTAG